MTKRMIFVLLGKYSCISYYVDLQLCSAALLLNFDILLIDHNNFVKRS